jgi:hypothetical protein
MTMEAPNDLPQHCPVVVFSWRNIPHPVPHPWFFFLLAGTQVPRPAFKLKAEGCIICTYIHRYLVQGRYLQSWPG